MRKSSWSGPSNPTTVRSVRRLSQYCSSPGTLVLACSTSQQADRKTCRVSVSFPLSLDSCYNIDIWGSWGFVSILGSTRQKMVARVGTHEKWYDGLETQYGIIVHTILEHRYCSFMALLKHRLPLELSFVRHWCGIARPSIWLSVDRLVSCDAAPTPHPRRALLKRPKVDLQALRRERARRRFTRCDGQALPGTEFEPLFLVFLCFGV